jgi:hypothetical protein
MEGDKGMRVYLVKGDIDGKKIMGVTMDKEIANRMAVCPMEREYNKGDEFGSSVIGIVRVGTGGSFRIIHITDFIKYINSI